MKKTSAYARKRRHLGPIVTFNAAAAPAAPTPEPKRCLSCGRAQELDGSLPCGH